MRQRALLIAQDVWQVDSKSAGQVWVNIIWRLVDRAKPLMKWGQTGVCLLA